MISTKCSLKVFNFRHVHKPGTLKLDKQSKKLIFKEDGIGHRVFLYFGHCKH